MKEIEIQQSLAICEQPGRYIGWPSIAAAADGTLFAVFSGDRDAHVCPFGKVFLTISKDEGRTWGVPNCIANSPLDDRDAGVCVCPDGTVVVSWFTSHFADYAWQYKVEYLKNYPEAEDRWPAWEEQLAGITPEIIAQWAPSYESPDEGDFLKRWTGFWTIRSRDGGATWDAPALSPVYAPHGPTVLSNGDLLFVGMRHLARTMGDDCIGAARSTDQGLTWKMLATIDGFPTYRGTVTDGFSRLGEPHVVETLSGKLIGMARYEETQHPDHPYQSRLWQFDSMDGGHTWSAPCKLEIIGKPPSLLCTSSGDILVSYGFRHQPFSERACFSHDEGVSWDYANEIVFQYAPMQDLGYTSTAEYRPGHFVTVYYQKESMEKKTLLFATRWKKSGA